MSNTEHVVRFVGADVAVFPNLYDASSWATFRVTGVGTQDEANNAAERALREERAYWKQ